MHDEYTIRSAEELAVKTMLKSLSENKDKPHPSVGAVALFPDGKMISCYRGEFSDGEHAEYGLLERKCQNMDLSDAIIFTTLEPCHSRNKPKEPCCVRLKKRHVKTIYIGIDDPDPSVAGKGKKYLEDNDIEIRYFYRDLQTKISEANEAYLEDAVKRAKKTVFVKQDKKDDAGYLGQICSGFDASDISIRELRAFARKAGLPSETDSILRGLSKIGLTHIEESGFSFTNGFILLFSKKPSKYLLNSVIKLKFNLADFELDEPLIKLPSSFETWLKERMPFSTTRSSGGERKKDYIYPLDPIKEAFINALVHRDYCLSGSRTQIVLNEHLISINSPGYVVNPQLLSDLSSFRASSVVRNHEINYVFKIMGFVENNNLGMDKFKAVPSISILPSPTFSYKAPTLSVTFYFSYESLINDVRFKYQDGLNDNEIATLEILKGHSPLVNSELMKMLMLPNAKAAQRILTGLEAKGLVVARGNTKGRIYLLK